MHPESVKRREYAGIFLILLGLLMCAIGLLNAVSDWQVALGALGMIGAGAGALTAGTIILSTIPTLVHDPEEG